MQFNALLKKHGTFLHSHPCTTVRHTGRALSSASSCYGIKTKQFCIFLIYRIVCFNLRNLAQQKRPFEKDLLSGKRDSNSRPQPWQGCALPTELFPQMFLKCGAKIGKKIETPNIRAAKRIKFLTASMPQRPRRRAEEQKKPNQNEAVNRVVRYLKTRMRASVGSNVFGSGVSAGSPNGICAIRRHSSGKCHSERTSLSINGL